MTGTCIVLAGGLGTRLRSVVADKPKCMAPVGPHPFLYYLLQYLHGQGITHAVLSLGYKSEQVIAWCEATPLPLRVSFVIEPEPLGTGGGIMYALSQVTEDAFFICNGDTYFDVSLADMYAYHTAHDSQLTIALKPMRAFDRYGSIDLDDAGRITAFREKQYCEEGLINGGIYLSRRSFLDGLQLPVKHSFEKEVLEVQVQQGQVYGYNSDTYFIDIGIPADYAQAQQDLVS